MKEPVEHIECRSAIELLSRLHPRQGKWQADEGWFFRGHGDGKNWRLLPSAFRRPSWQQALSLFEFDPTEQDIDFWEQMLLFRFYRLLDRAGLPIPRAEELIRLEERRLVSDAPWPDPILEPLLALAQHNGVPTRLLDWTSSRKVAAYFAAIDALHEKSEALDVWALSGHFVNVFGAALTDISCRIVRTHRYGNPNLHAQAGVFTLCRGVVRDEDGFIPLDEFLTVLARGLPAGDIALPCLRRFRLPTSAARDLLKELHDDEIDAVTLFPGYLGVVRALREEHWLVPPDAKGMPRRDGAHSPRGIRARIPSGRHAAPTVRGSGKWQGRRKDPES